MTLNSDEQAEVISMMHTQGWAIFKNWLAEHNEQTFVQIDEDLEGSIVNLFKREQLLGARKHSKFLVADFSNFVTTQTHKDKDYE